jgi:hypothetical protein
MAIKHTATYTSADIELLIDADLRKRGFKRDQWAGSQGRSAFPKVEFDVMPLAKLAESAFIVGSALANTYPGTLGVIGEQKPAKKRNAKRAGKAEKK